MLIVKYKLLEWLRDQCLSPGTLREEFCKWLLTPPQLNADVAAARQPGLSILMEEVTWSPHVATNLTAVGEHQTLTSPGKMANELDDRHNQAGLDSNLVGQTKELLVASPSVVEAKVDTVLQPQYQGENDRAQRIPSSPYSPLMVVGASLASSQLYCDNRTECIKIAQLQRELLNGLDSRRDVAEDETDDQSRSVMTVDGTSLVPQTDSGGDVATLSNLVTELHGSATWSGLTNEERHSMQCQHRWLGVGMPSEDLSTYPPQSEQHRALSSSEPNLLHPRCAIPVSGCLIHRMKWLAKHASCTGILLKSPW
eukprot:SAG31_NODE_2437_length_5696_cov_2.259067_5_plen_311_part_00